MPQTWSFELLAWGVFPYVALTLFFVVPFLRMIYRPFGLTTRASGIFLGRDVLGPASHLLHWGIFLVFFGHVAGLVGGIRGWGGWVDAFFWMATLGGLAAIVGSVIALARRIMVPEMRAMSHPDDYIVHLFLIAILGVAIYQALGQRLWGLSYTVAPWFASLWRFQPQPELMASASILTKTHIFLAFAFAAYFPFTKLIHAWTLPVNYFVRPYQVMRTVARKFQNRWEYSLVSDKSYMTYVAVGVVGLLVGVGFLLPGPNVEGGGEGALAAAAAEGEPGPQVESAALLGYPLYVSQCARCHGLTGEGDGPGANSTTFSAPPRDLTSGHYRFVSTMSGVATDEDLRRTIVHGLNGSGMPAFDQLSEGQVQSLVAVLDHMWRDRPEAGDPIAIPPRPAASPAMVAEGKAIFAENCSLCHGAKGLGDGEFADSIVDARGQPVRPRNLVSGAIKGGAGSTQLFHRISAGIPGGEGQYVMPQWADLGPEQIWALVSYLEAELLPRRVVADAKRAQ